VGVGGDRCFHQSDSGAGSGDTHAGDGQSGDPPPEGHVGPGMPAGSAEDKSGTLILKETFFEPNPRFSRAIQEMQGTPLESTIDQTIVRIRLMSGKILDLAHELDPSGE